MENNIPEKFKDENGGLNSEALLKSYLELEKKIGAMVNVPADDADDAAKEKFKRAIGVPANADEYPCNPMFEDMPEVKERFLQMGLTAKQAEELYKMAAEMISPAISELASARYESEHMDELYRFFGDEEKMRAAMSDINDYAEKNLSPEAIDALCSSADGVKAIYNMMQSKEPSVMTSGKTAEPVTENSLRQMMKDPRYWRDRDEEFIRKVEAGFRKLYK